MKLEQIVINEMPMGRVKGSGPYDDPPEGYSIGRRIRATELTAGMKVAASYNQYNHGTDFVEILGFTGNDKKYGDGGAKYKSVKEMLRANGVRSLRALEEKDDENEYGYSHYMCLRDLTAEKGAKHSEGCWYYLDEGRWARGSGAEKLSFMTLEQEVAADAGETQNSLRGQRIVFTGFRDNDLARQAQSAGAEIQNNVRRDTTMVVALNPNSASGKAEKARSYGARVVGVDDLKRLLANSEQASRRDFERMSMEGIENKKEFKRRTKKFFKKYPKKDTE